MNNKQKIFWWLIIYVLILIISVLHYTTPTMKWQYHLIFMQAYFIPILIGSLQFGIRGGLGSAAVVSIIYFPHIMLQWGGLVETNLMRFMQIGLFNIIGYLTGLKSQAEKEEKLRYQKTAEELKASLDKLQKQSDEISKLEEQLRLADRLAVVGELTASLAHEVRNPLGAIRGATEILRDELPQEMKSSEFFGILIEETNRLSAVLENYLSFTRKKKQRLSEFEFGEVVQSVIQLLNYSARKAEINCELQLPETPVLLHGDPNHLRQILVNLILNSMQAMPNGGDIFISTQIYKQQVSNQETEQTEYLELKVQDTGDGINSDDLLSVFKPFFTTKSNGSGLGLAIVKRLTESNHWHIDVKSDPGKGTVFTLKLPVV